MFTLLFAWHAIIYPKENVQNSKFIIRMIFGKESKKHIHAVVSCDAYLNSTCVQKWNTHTKSPQIGQILQNQRKANNVKELFQFQGQWKTTDIWWWISTIRAIIRRACSLFASFGKECTFQIIFLLSFKILISSAWQIKMTYMWPQYLASTGEDTIFKRIESTDIRTLRKLTDICFWLIT